MRGRFPSHEHPGPGNLGGWLGIAMLVISVVAIVLIIALA
jgi:hypothetical protein